MSIRLLYFYLFLGLTKSKGHYPNKALSEPHEPHSFHLDKRLSEPHQPNHDKRLLEQNQLHQDKILSEPHRLHQDKRFLAKCPAFNFMCQCPKYINGCYTCPSQCFTGTGNQYGIFQPGGSSGAGTQVPSGQSATGEMRGSGSAANGTQTMNGMSSFGVFNGNSISETASQSNNCPPNPVTDPNIPWSACHIDDTSGCFICGDQAASRPNTTEMQKNTTLQSSFGSVKYQAGSTTFATKQTNRIESTTKSTNTINRITTVSPVTSQANGIESTTKSTDTKNSVSTVWPITNQTNRIESTTTSTNTKNSVTTVSPNAHNSTQSLSATTDVNLSMTNTTGNVIVTWSEWYYGACTSSCGEGTVRRLRHCSTGCDKDCVGNPFETVPCTASNCPVDGGWSMWAAWDVCSSTCGEGTHARTRRCDSPPPQHGGSHCTGSMTETKSCRLKECPHWLPFDAITSCSVTCGTGFIQFKRLCSTGNQSDCSGSAYTEKQCHLPPCV